MDEADRRLLRRCRLRLVSELQVAPLWDALLSREIFTPDMIEDIQRAGSGSRRDQARQLIIDLETRGSRALPLFISCLEDTAQDELASLLRSGAEKRSSSTEKPRQNMDLVYVLSADPCGHCLIINNINFLPESRLDDRTGSDLDCQKLQYRFQLLHFSVEVKCDLTTKEMNLVLAELAQRDHSAMDCCVVVILSHGHEVSHRQFPGAVCGIDGSSVSIERIVNIFNGTGCPSLRGKPKLFFIQACGGKLKDRGFEVASTSPKDRASGSNPEQDAAPFQEGSGTCDQPDAVSSLPTPSDIFVSYSTFPGFVSLRDPKSGSWYVEVLDSVLEQWAPYEDLQSLLLRVGKAVADKGICKQMPGCFNFLRKKFFFKTH